MNHLRSFSIVLLLCAVAAAPGTARVVPLFRRYAEVVDDLPLEEPSLDEDADPGSWAGQFSQRVRKSGLVVGTADLLGSEPKLLHSLWGIFEGSDASWVWLDSAAIHSALAAEGIVDIPSLHLLLQQRGRRHLSPAPLLTAY